MLQTENSLLTIGETSCFIRVSKNTVRKYVKDGKLAAFQPGKKILISKESIEKFLNQDKKEATNG